ncbi:MAG: lipopolysaccharide biosynthesis protein [Gammaproteobacteria bacterium]
MTSLGNKVFRAAVWAVGMRLFIKSLGLINTIVLARLLIPEDFGLVAIVMAVYQFIALLKSFGFDVVLIQKQDASDTVYNTAWTMQLLFGLTAGLLMLVFAPLIASYYGDERLADIALVTAFIFMVNGAINIGVVNFRKNLEFHKDFLFLSSVKVVTVICTIALAYYFRSYWALIIGSLISAFLELGLSYVMSSFRPVVTLRAWREIMSFSSWLLLSSFISFFNNRAVYLIVGRLINVPAAGILTMGSEFASLPNDELVAAVNRATFPGYSKISDDRKALRSLYLQTLSAIALIGIPGSIGVAVLAPVFVPVVLGNNWLETVPLMQLLGFAFALISINTNSGYVFHAIGKPHIPTIASAFRVVGLLAAIFFFIDGYGLIGAAYAIGLMACVMLPVYVLLLRKWIGLKLADYLRALYRPLLAAGVMYFAVASFTYGTAIAPSNASPDASLPLLLQSVALGVLVFGVTVLGLWRLSGMPDGVERNALQIARRYLPG